MTQSLDNLAEGSITPGAGGLRSGAPTLPTALLHPKIPVEECNRPLLCLPAAPSLQGTCSVVPSEGVCLQNRRLLTRGTALWQRTGGYWQRPAPGRWLCPPHAGSQCGWEVALPAPCRVTGCFCAGLRLWCSPGLGNDVCRSVKAARASRAAPLPNAGSQHGGKVLESHMESWQLCPGAVVGQVENLVLRGLTLGQGAWLSHVRFRDAWLCAGAGVVFRNSGTVCVCWLSLEQDGSSTPLGASSQPISQCNSSRPALLRFGWVRLLPPHDTG